MSGQADNRKSSDPRKSIRREAEELGFSACRFTEARLPEITGNHLSEFVAAGHHATMGWMEETLQRRRSPDKMWSDAKSAIVLTMNYGPETDPLAILEERDRGAISVYARNRDYHDIIKGKLKILAGKIASAQACEVKVFVDTAPLMEKPLAARAGAGWQGKHTNLVSREFGSWLFLGVILTSKTFEADAAETDHCGTCRACFDICPTNAFPAPYRIDAGRCISYLTIEHAGPVPREFRAAMGNRIYGCDDCLAVCPWNKFAETAREAKLKAREDLNAPQLEELARLDDAAFRKHFSGSPIKRTGRNRFIRNVLIAIGNSAMPELAASAEALIADEDPVVRGASVWALSRLVDRDAFRSLASDHEKNERDESVLDEWRAATAKEQGQGEAG